MRRTRFKLCFLLSSFRKPKGNSRPVDLFDARVVIGQAEDGGADGFAVDFGNGGELGNDEVLEVAGHPLHFGFGDGNEAPNVLARIVVTRRNDSKSS